MLARLRDAAEQVGHKPRDRIVVALGQVHAGQVGDLVDRGRAVHGEFVLADPENLFRLVVVLVLDVAEDRFDQVLQRDEARRAAVFVDDHGDLDAPLLQLAEKLAAFFRFGDEVGRAHHVAQADEVRHGLADVGEKILDVADAGDRVDVLAVDRQAGKALFGGDRGDVLDRRILADRADVRAVRHDLADRRVVEIEDVRDHVELGLLDHALFLALADHVEDLLLGHGFIERPGVVAEQAHDAVGDQVAQPHERAHRGAERADQADELIVILQAAGGLVRHELFGDEIGREQKQHGAQQHAQHNRCDRGEAGQQARRNQRVVERGREAEHGNADGEKAHQHHAELQGRGEALVCIEVGEEFLCAAAPVLGVALDARFARRRDGGIAHGIQYAEQEKDDEQCGSRRDRQYGGGVRSARGIVVHKCLASFRSEWFQFIVTKNFTAKTDCCQHRVAARARRARAASEKRRGFGGSLRNLQA